MAEFFNRLKRKERNSSTDSENLSPDGKKPCNVSGNEGSDSCGEHEGDQVLVALTMSETIGQQLKLILDRLTSVESKLDGVLEKVQSLEATMSSVQGDVKVLENKASKMEKKANEMDQGLNNLNAEVEELRTKVMNYEKDIQAVNDRYLYQEVYNRRENLRFLGIPELETTEENTRDVIYRFLDRDLELEGAREIEFQRVHRIGKKKRGASRPIIARFLRFPDRERVFKRALDIREELEVKVYADFPKEIQEKRKKQWPKLKRAREEGKVASFSKTEPDKLFIEGRYIPM